MESITLELQTGSGSKAICMPGAGKGKEEQKTWYQRLHAGLLPAEGSEAGKEALKEGGHFQQENALLRFSQCSELCCWNNFSTCRVEKQVFPVVEAIYFALAKAPLFVIHVSLAGLNHQCFYHRPDNHTQTISKRWYTVHVSSEDSLHPTKRWRLKVCPWMKYPE